MLATSVPRSHRNDGPLQSALHEALRPDGPCMTVPGKAAATPRLVVICNSFPVLSETFIVDHVTGMLDSGWSVTIVASKVDWEGAVKVYAGEGVRLELIELPDSRRESRWRRWLTVWRALQRWLGSCHRMCSIESHGHVPGEPLP